MSLRGVWLDQHGMTARADLEEPAAADGDALVRVGLAGICGTDLELRRGYASFAGIPGHEFVGVVESGPASWPGSRVVAEINVTCASYRGATTAATTTAGAVAAGGATAGGAVTGPPIVCAQCRAGRDAHCSIRTVIGIRGRDGAFAERLAVPVANLHRVPESVTDEAAVFVEPLAAAFRVVEQVAPRAGDRVLVVGPGRLGVLVARALATTPAELQVAGRSRRGLERAGASGLATLSTGDIPRGRYDVAVDCTGHPEGFMLARAAVRPGGTVVLKSTYAEPGRPTAAPPEAAAPDSPAAGAAGRDPAGQDPAEIGAASARQSDPTGSPAWLGGAAGLVIDEIRVLGSRCGPFPAAIEALATGAVDVSDLVDARYPLDEVEAAFSRAAEPGAGKILIEPRAGPPTRA